MTTFALYGPPEELYVALRDPAPDEGLRWLEDRVDEAEHDPGVVAVAFPTAGRRLGRGPLDTDAEPGDPFAWTVDDAGRTLLLAALGERVGEELPGLYRHGDTAEKRGVLRALPYLPVGEAGVPLVDDALRTNDTGLVAAALGPYALAHLDDAALAQAVLKCVFVGLDVGRVEGLEARVTPEMSAMLAGYAHERVAAGRDVPSEIWPLVDLYPPKEELAAIEAELDHPVEDRRRAAEKALSERRIVTEGSR